MSHHEEIRTEIADFEEAFDMDEDYHEDTLEFKLRIFLEGEPDHVQNLRDAGEWGTNIDIMAACLLYNLNVVIFQLFRREPNMRVERIYPVGHPAPAPAPAPAPTTCYLLYNTLHRQSEHYEAMFPRQAAGIGVGDNHIAAPAKKKKATTKKAEKAEKAKKAKVSKDTAKKKTKAATAAPPKKPKKAMVVIDLVSSSEEED
jgi:hypothetical protein